MTLVGLIHSHSWYSFDSVLPPRAYLAYALHSGLDFLCITDHNTIRGAVEIARLNRSPHLQVVIGAEFATEQGDVIGLFLEDEITDRSWHGVVQSIKRQGGLVLLPHPHRHHSMVTPDWNAVDIVEVFNARSSDMSNQEALRDALRFGIAQIAGADTHTLWELYRNGTTVSLAGRGDLREQLLEAPRTFTTRSSSRNLTRYSRVIKTARRHLGLSGSV